MCGIVGLFSKSTAVEERLGEHLGAMLGQLSDRGPDSAGVAVYRDPAPTGASKVSLHSADPGEDWGRVRDGLAQAFGGDAEPEVRAQLHALAGLVRNLEVPTDAARPPLARELADALAAGDEARTLAAARALARADRAFVQPVDWRAASGG